MLRRQDARGQSGAREIVGEMPGPLWVLRRRDLHVQRAFRAHARAVGCRGAHGTRRHAARQPRGEHPGIGRATRHFTDLGQRIGPRGHYVLAAPVDQHPVRGDRRQVGLPFRGHDAGVPFDRQIHDPRRITDGRASQQPAAEQIKPERGDGTGQCHAVELFFLVAVDDGESGHVAPGDIDPVAGW